MLAIASVRGIAALFLLGGSGAVAQSALPASSPTANPAVATQERPAVASPTGHRAQVVYSRGALEITADDSSLNQILRDIGRQTGMKITGTVSDERVFGDYGPGRPSEVLESLLEGTGSNMLLRETAEHAPAELILTPRVGGVTPPNPNARNYDDDSTSRGEPQRLPYPVQPVLPPQPSENVTGAVAVPAAAGVASGGGAQTSGATNPPSPNGPATPQQIFEQLQRLQQAQPQQPANPQ